MRPRTGIAAFATLMTTAGVLAAAAAGATAAHASTSADARPAGAALAPAVVGAGARVRSGGTRGRRGEHARCGHKRGERGNAGSRTHKSLLSSSDALVCGLPSMDIPSHRTAAGRREIVGQVNERFRWRDLLPFG